MSDQPFIRVEDVHREFHMGEETVHALDGVSLSVVQQESLSVLGPSGSGKSTLLYLLGGLDHCDAGRIWVRGQEITALDENGLASYRRQEVGFVFQSFNLIATMTALENVMFPMIFARVPAARRRERGEHVLEMVGLAHRMDHKPTELSGGQQQRVAMARALVNDPALVLADEPTGNLDSQTGAEVLAILSQLNEEQGCTLVVVSHDPLVVEYTSRSIHLLDGHVVDGSPAVVSPLEGG